jgi:pimeloyl-ACP methyl ester carboxylesterase
MGRAVVVSILTFLCVSLGGPAAPEAGAAVAGPASTASSSPAAAAGTQTVLSADSIPIVYTVQGKGEPALVFVHCWSCDKSYWTNQVPAFDKKHTVVTLDLAGHGESGTGRKDWTIQSFAGDVAAVVTALDLKRVILIGHSMGGPVALEAARRMPGRVIGIIGVDTFQDFEEKYTDQQTNQMLLAFKANFPAVTDRFVRSMFPPKADSALVSRIASDMASESPEVGIGAMKNMMDYDPLPALAEIKAPIRSINADLWPTNVEGNQRHAKSFKVSFMPGHGHFLHLEDPEAFNKLLAQTIDEIVKAK